MEIVTLLFYPSFYVHVSLLLRCNSLMNDTDSMSIVSQTPCISCRMDNHQRSLTSETPSYAKTQCRVCRFDMSEDSWYVIKPCTPHCKICPDIECISYTYKPFDSTFPDLNIHCPECNKYCRYYYCKKGITIKSVSLEYIHITARQLELKACCLIKPPFPFRQTDRRCRTCTKSALQGTR